MTTTASVLMGLTPPAVSVTSAPVAAATPASLGAPVAPTTGVAWHQHPLLVIVLVVVAVVVLARLAEHGFGLGVWVS